MNDWNEWGRDSMRRVFSEGFSASDLAESLTSFDAETDADVARDCMRRREFDAAGVRREGAIAGYVMQEDLRDGTCGDHARTFDDSARIEASSPFSEVVLGLTDSPRLFVSILGAVGGIITRADLQKPPMRMWLFGMVTIIETRFAWMIERFRPDETWKQFVSESRLQKAEMLLEERKRRNQNLRLVDCLQFSDKGQIIAKDATLRVLTQFKSRRKTEEIVKELESLRNHLAHSQDVIACDWEVIVKLTENLDRIIEGPPSLRKNAESEIAE
ncbi:MAG: hypothetical protein N2C14_16015 [Planctomycetales bacterium]